jgi:hypothetical protein
MSGHRGKADLTLEGVVFHNKGYEIRHHCLRLFNPGMPFCSFSQALSRMHATIRLPRGVGFLDLHVEPTQILQFAGLPFGSILSISLQNDAARTIASKNEIGHFVCLEVSEKKAAGTARCDQPGSNNLVRKTLDPPTLSFEY